LIVKKEPIEAMKEVNKVIGKKGKYKNLTQKDIDKIVADTEDHIFQRDPDNLYVDDKDLTKSQLIEKEGRKYDLENIEGSADDMSLEDSLTELEGLGATQTAERFRLKQKYPGIDDTLVTNIINDTDPNNKARVLAILDEAMLLGNSGKSSEEIVEIIKSTPKKEMATGGRAGFYSGGQSMIEPDLSDIGHGSDSLMARTRLTAPGSQATTSTGLNYLLGEDNDNTRVPFNSGLLVPPPKPKNFSKTLDLLNSKAAVNTLSPKTYANLVGQFAKKAFDNGELSEREYMKIVQPLFGQVGEMVTEKIREYENFNKGGRINFQGGGGADMGTVADSQGNVNENLGKI
jgi:hypothetical protein